MFGFAQQRDIWKRLEVLTFFGHFWAWCRWTFIVMFCTWTGRVLKQKLEIIVFREQVFQPFVTHWMSFQTSIGWLMSLMSRQAIVQWFGVWNRLRNKVFNWHSTHRTSSRLIHRRSLSRHYKTVRARCNCRHRKRGSRPGTVARLWLTKASPYAPCSSICSSSRHLSSHKFASRYQSTNRLDNEWLADPKTADIDETEVFESKILKVLYFSADCL